MKKILAVIVCCWFSVFVEIKAQVNLVPNPSFEDTISCPIMFNQLYLAIGWSAPTFGGTSDYFNTCSDPAGVGIPKNYFGHEAARSGNGYAGFAIYDNSNQREYIQAKLHAKLMFAHKYCVEFYVSLGDTFSFACNNIGVYFSDTAVHGNNSYPLNFNPQVSNDIINNPLTDKTSWTKVSGSFVACGEENYITIGNFLYNANSDTIHVIGGYDNSEAYYYIDDISVVDCTGIGIYEITGENSLEIYPNPASSTLTIENTNSRIENVKLYNVLGSEMLNQVQHDERVTVDISGFSKGIYFIEAETEKGIFRKKFIKE